MGDGISFSMDTSAFDDMITAIGPVTDRATKYALRATGRYIARVAKAKAPVYKGTDPRATAESGNLKKSIANAKMMTGAGGNYQLKVGPFGSKKKGTAVTRHGTGKGEVRGVPLYRGKAEAKYGYMAAAIDAAESDATKAIYEAAYQKAWAKWST